MPACNAHGVYDADELLSLPRPVKGWRGCSLADIKLADLGTHWIWATSFQMMTGDCHGSASPLMDTESPIRSHRAPTREAAIEAALQELRQRLGRKECADARAVLTWLDTLNPAQMDMFA